MDHSPTNRLNGEKHRVTEPKDAPEIYYITDYFRRYPVVLVRLSRIDRDALWDLLSGSWRLALAKARPRTGHTARNDW